MSLRIPRVSEFDELLPVMVIYAQRQSMTSEDWCECARAWWRLEQVESFWVCVNEALQLVKTFKDQCVCAELLKTAGDPNALEFIKKQFPI